MAPRKQPRSLVLGCVRVVLDNINRVCGVVYDEEGEFEYCKESVRLHTLRHYLYANLPSRLFDLLCQQRMSSQRHVTGDPCIQLSVLAHPRLTCLTANPDTTIPHQFWLSLLPSLTHLVELSLKLICTDEILSVIGEHCHLLEEVNAMSRVDLKRSPFNATVLTRNVSDSGLNHLITLKRLRILSIDPPRNNRVRWKMGRCISQAGIRNLVSNLPSLEELRVESCDIGTTLVGGGSLQGLTLKKIDCHFASPDSVEKLLNMCPSLTDLSLTHLFGSQSDKVLQEVTKSDNRLNRLELSFFEYSSTMSHLLSIKGNHITTFSLVEIENSITFDGIITIGKYCPNLVKFRLITPSTNLQVSHSYRAARSQQLFTNLKTLTLGFHSVDMREIVLFFVNCARKLIKLDLKHKIITNLDDMFIKLVNEDMLNCLENISLDAALPLSANTIKYMMDKCQSLHYFMVSCYENDRSLQQYIKNNNYDVILISNYCS